MRIHLPLLLIAALLVVPVPSFAIRGPLDDVLELAATGRELRPRLVAFADSVAAEDPYLASQAHAHAASSWERDGEPDSAIAERERALALDSREPRRMELANALLLRLAPGDAPRALDVLRPVQPITPLLPDPTQAVTQGLFAWAHYLGGQPDSAARLFAPIETWLSEHQEWRYRMACVAIDQKDWTRALILLTPLAVASRTYDQDVMDLMHRAADELNSERRLDPMLQQAIRSRDLVEQELLTKLGARRLAFRGADGFPVGGVLLTPPGVARPRAAVVLVAPGDTLASYDSLAIGLRNSGLAVLLLEPRGSGLSVGPSCPLPGSWQTRARAMQEKVAGDVADAASLLAREAGCDSTAYLLVGVGTMGPVTMLAARQDRRVRALMLVSPVASPAERGALIEAAASLRCPVYFQTGPEDFASWDLIDALYRVGDLRASRVADSDLPGTRPTLFRRDPRIMARFRQWLDESWSRPVGPRATRPSRRP